MKTIKVREVKDIVYWLTSDGIICGYVSKVYYSQDEYDKGIVKYYVRDYKDSKEYQGLLKLPNQLFNSKESLINSLK